MISSIPTLLYIAFAFYAIAIASTFFPKCKNIILPFLAIAFVIHSCALCVFYNITNSLPSSNIYGLIEVISWGCALVAIVGYIAKIQALRNLPIIMATILAIIPMGCPVFSEYVSSPKKVSTLIIQLHAFFAALSYTMMFVGFASSLAYLYKHNKLKKKIEQGSKKGISLEGLNKSVKISIIGATITMMISIVLGIIGIQSENLVYPFMIKTIIGSSIFTVQIYVAINIILQNIKGTALAKTTSILLMLSVVALIPIELRHLFL